MTPRDTAARILAEHDPGAVRYWRARATDAELRWASRSLAPDLLAVAS